MRVSVFALMLVACIDPSDSTSGPVVTSRVSRHEKILTAGPRQTLEAHCMPSAPLDIDPAVPGIQFDCASWIEHHFEDGLSQEAFEPCEESAAERCYQIEHDPQVCLFDSGYEVVFIHPFTDIKALVSKAIVECVVQ